MTRSIVASVSWGCLQKSMILLGTWLRSEAGRSWAYTGASWLFDCMTAYAWWQPLMLASCKQLWQWVPSHQRKYEGWETSMLYFSDALIIGHFGLKDELLTSSPTQFETFSDTARFYSSQFKWKSLVLHYWFTFCIIPFSLKLLLHNFSPFFLGSRWSHSIMMGLSKDCFPILCELFGVTHRQILT